jgi:hypothetical protein
MVGPKVMLPTLPEVTAEVPASERLDGTHARETGVAEYGAWTRRDDHGLGSRLSAGDP